MSGAAGNLQGIGPMNPKRSVLELYSLVDSCGYQAVWKMLQERNFFLKNLTKGSSLASPTVI